MRGKDTCCYGTLNLEVERTVAANRANGSCDQTSMLDSHFVRREVIRGTFYHRKARQMLSKMEFSG